MKFIIKKIIKREICHYSSSEMLITSQFNKIYIQRGNKELIITLPNTGWKKFFGIFRLSRRALRLDKCNVVPVKDGFVIIRQGIVFHYDEIENKLKQVLKLKNCRNVLHQSIVVINQKELFFGEYGNNRSRSEIPIYRSKNSGKQWEIIYTIPPGKAKHIHGCYYDHFDDKIWTLTGDFENECHILCADRDFNNVEWIGNGNQEYRACNMFFEKDSIHWIMDSPLVDSHHIKFDRKTHTIKKKQLFPGPVWYIKRLDDGYYLATTAQEIGPSIKDKYAHIMYSTDLEEWKSIYKFKHDRYPKKYFKFGVIGFADGQQNSKNFYIFNEALKELEGKVALCEIIKSDVINEK